jgi:hypothetical protein
MMLLCEVIGVLFLIGNKYNRGETQKVNRMQRSGTCE